MSTNSMQHTHLPQHQQQLLQQHDRLRGTHCVHATSMPKDPGLQTCGRESSLLLGARPLKRERGGRQCVLGLPLSLLLCFPLVSSLQLMQFPLLSPLLLSLSLWLMSLLLLLLLLLWRRRLVQVLERAWQVCPHLEKGKSGKQ